VPERPHDPAMLADRAARRLGELTDRSRHDVAVVLGSGWLPAADALGPARSELSFDDLPGFSVHAAQGHVGRIRSITCGRLDVLVYLGRTHLYEGRGVDAVAHAVRTSAAAGCTTVVLTNAAGGLHPEWVPGTPVLIRDHLNLTGHTPLVGPRFVDMSDVYSPSLRSLCRRVRPDLAEGVYAQFAGPQYETPAEVTMAGRLGADLVGMSTALEAIAARAEGMRVLGLSLVTNPAAGVTDRPLDHHEVLAAARASAGRLGDLLAAVLPRLEGSRP
jgi:purine-nucleoside phosphorylase